MLGTKTQLVSSSSLLVTHCLPLLSSDGTDVPKPVPFRSFGLLVVPVLEEPIDSWAPSHRSVGTEVVDLAKDLLLQVNSFVWVLAPAFWNFYERNHQFSSLKPQQSAAPRILT